MRRYVFVSNCKETFQPKYKQMRSFTQNRALMLKVSQLPWAHVLWSTGARETQKKHVKLTCRRLIIER